MIIYNISTIIYFRPKKQSAKEMAEKTVALRTRTQELLLFARKIQDDRENFSTEKTEMGCCSKMGKTRKIEKMTKKLKVEYHKLEQHLEIYDLENTLTANPLVACLKLVLGRLIYIYRQTHFQISKYKICKSTNIGNHFYRNIEIQKYK